MNPVDLSNPRMDDSELVSSTVALNNGVDEVGDDFSSLLMKSLSPFSNITHEEKRNYLSREDYSFVRNAGYEKDLLTKTGSIVHAQNSIYVNRVISSLRAENSTMSSEKFQLLVERKLPDILLDGVKNNKIDLSHYKPKGDGKRDYGKYLLFSNKSQSSPFCFQLFVFSENQKTRLHSHIAPCSTTVLQGVIEESLYKSTIGTRKSEPLADFVSSDVRHKGSVAGFNEDQLFDIHKIKNISKEYKTLEAGGHGYAISVHYYQGIDGVSQETQEATALRKTPTDWIGKTNAAEFFRKVRA